MAEFFEKILNWLNEPVVIASALVALTILLIIVFIMSLIANIKILKTKRKLDEHLYDTKLSEKVTSLNSISKNIVEDKNESTPVILEPEPTIEAVNETTDREIKEEKKTPVKRDKSGMMAFSFEQLKEIARTLGVEKHWKNKSDVVAGIKVLLKSEKCTKAQLLETLKLEFLKVTPEELKAIYRQKKADLLVLLRNKIY